MKVLFFILVSSMGFFHLSACTHQALASSSYDKCVTEGGRILKTMPPKCINSEGQILVRPTAEASKRRLCSDLCGNGQCEEIVCMGEGCPCAENAKTCATDCTKN